MQVLGSTPLADQRIRDEDFAAKLVRVPAQAGTAADAGRESFDKVLSRTVNDGGGAIGKNTGATKHAKQEKRLWDACIEMESLFVGRMLKEMRKTVHKSGWINGGFAEEIFEDMLYDEYALSLSRNSNLGLAKMLYNELKQKV